MIHTRDWRVCRVDFARRLRISQAPQRAGDRTLLPGSFMTARKLGTRPSRRRSGLSSKRLKAAALIEEKTGDPGNAPISSSRKRRASVSFEDRPAARCSLACRGASIAGESGRSYAFVGRRGFSPARESGLGVKRSWIRKTRRGFSL